MSSNDLVFGFGYLNEVIRSLCESMLIFMKKRHMNKKEPHEAIKCTHISNYNKLCPKLKGLLKFDITQHLFIL